MLGVNIKQNQYGHYVVNGINYGDDISKVREVLQIKYGVPTMDIEQALYDFESQGHNVASFGHFTRELMFTRFEGLKQ